jgi:two-component system sensor kinase FixL
MNKDVAQTADAAELERRLCENPHVTQRVLAAAPVFIYVYDLASESAVYFNRSAADYLGYDLPDLQALGATLLVRIIHPDDLAHVSEHQRAMASAGDEEVREVEYRVRHASGQWRWIRSRDAIFSRDAQGRAQQILGSAEDTTERRLTEASLAQAKLEWEQTFDALPDLIMVLDHESRIVNANQAVADRLGIPRDQCVGQVCYELIHHVDGPPANCPHRRFQVDGRSHAAEISDRWLGGDFLVSVSPLPHRDGVGRRCVHVARDISAIKRVERSLRESQETLQALLNATPEVAFLIDCQGKILALNEPLGERLGTDAQSLIGECVFDHLAAPAARSQREITEQARRSGRPVHFQELHDDRQLEGMVWPVRDAEGRVASLAIYSRDVTHQRQAEDALRSSEAKFRSYIEHAPVAVLVIDNMGRNVEVNATACAMFGYTEEEFLRMALPDLLGPSAASDNAVFGALFEDSLSGEEIHLRRKDGSSFWGSLSAVRLSSDRLLAFVADITELKIAEESQQQLQGQLVHMGRVATVGEMIAGIAHEVNQPLYSIVNYAKASGNLLSQDEPPIPELRECNKEIADAAVRAGDIIARVRTFLGRSESQRSPASLCQLIEETVALVAYQTQHHGVSLSAEFDDPLVSVDVDRVQIQQVLINLLQNAWEALEEVPAGNRRVSIRTTTDATTVEVSVGDNGPGLKGIPASRIFDPFVTTKRKGLGVGLSISKTIVQAHGGRIWQSDSSGGGVTLHFTLPVFDERHRYAR